TEKLNLRSSLNQIPECLQQSGYPYVCSQWLPQAIRTGSSTPLPPDNGNRGGGIVETGYTQWDIPLRSLVPDRGSRDRERFVPEASRLCLVSWGPQPSPEQAPLGYSSTRPVLQFLNSVLVNNSDLIFITMVVRHLFAPQRQDAFGFPGATPQHLHAAITDLHSGVPESSTPGSVNCDALA